LILSDIFAYVLALFVGLTLGLVGAGGSILTLPILVKVAGIEPSHAITYSMFIVGITAMVGAINYYRKGQMHVLTAMIFFLPSFLTVFVMRRFLMRLIPDDIWEFDTFILTKNILIFFIFGIVMFFAALSMITKKINQDIENQDIKNIKFNYLSISVQGVIIGIVTGMVGAGGGFLIIPSLIRFAKLPLRLTIGTSLLIITLNSFTGFIIDARKKSFPIDWQFLLTFSSIAIIGIIIGLYISNFIKADLLKKIFGYFVMIMALYIIGQEIFGAFFL
jgi:uncharacterized protein